MRNYLRVRGEYLAAGIAPFPRKELPPRARRILQPTTYYTNNIGTTSACAENTADTHRQNVSAGNYLRVRGEYRANRIMICSVPELPPRARRIR